ncbi:formyltransferase family protein [Hydrogenophaga sp.]|uniref:formyltransferase family protein n=1 Tax=Hydrogenophaga sp. TaxID=1904254 RepID=UPI00356961D4
MTSPAARTRNRVVLFCSDDVIPNIILNHALSEMVAMGLRPVVFLTPIPQPRTAPPPSLQRMAFYERGLLHAHIFPELDRSGPGRAATLLPALKSFTELARMHGGFHPIAQLDDERVSAEIDHPDFLGAVSAHNYLLFKTRHMHRIQQQGGFLWNLHHGPLPDNRGLLAPFWNLLEGRPAHGVSLHEITEGIDTGALIATARLRLSGHPSVLSSMIELGVPGAHLVVQTLRRLTHGHPVQPLPQPPRTGNYRSYPTEDDIQHAAHKGIRLVDSAADMARLYCELYGLSTAFSHQVLLPAIAAFEAQWADHRVPTVAPEMAAEMAPEMVTAAEAAEIGPD